MTDALRQRAQRLRDKLEQEGCGVLTPGCAEFVQADGVVPGVGILFATGELDGDGPLTRFQREVLQLFRTRGPMTLQQLLRCIWTEQEIREQRRGCPRAQTYYERMWGQLRTLTRQGLLRKEGGVYTHVPPKERKRGRKWRRTSK